MEILQSTRDNVPLRVSWEISENIKWLPLVLVYLYFLFENNFLGGLL